MRRLAFAWAMLAALPAGARELSVLGGVDALIASNPGGSGVEAAELGLTLNADLRGVAKRFDFRLAFTGRETLVGEQTLDNNLWELNGTVRGLGNRVDLTIGRFHTPGGFWLIADGARLNVHYTSWLEQSAYGGLRAFTTGRRNTWMTSDRPQALPLAGTSLRAHHRIVEGSLTFTWARDSIDLQSEQIPNVDDTRLERHVEDEYFVDGQVAIFPHEKVYLAGGATFGTRYDVQFNAAAPAGPTTLGIATLGAFGAYATAEYRPIKRLRLQYSFNYERVRLLQSRLLSLTPAGTPVQTADGSFQDHDLKIVGLVWHALRAELDYRLRFRENTDIEHHLTVGLRGDDLWRGLGGFASIGVDIDQGLDLPFDNATKKVHDRVIYSAGLSYLRHWMDLRAGITYTDGIGSGLVFSQQVATSSNAHPTTLFPYVLETNRVVFLRYFATFWKMYAGLDIEENLDQVQLRALLQVGAAL
jgi:hypothetical protein